MKHVVAILACAAVMMACSKREEKAPEPVVDSKPLPTEIADPKYIDIGKKALANLNANNLDGFMTMFSENSRYYFSAGDSLIGKAAISSFWKDRFGKVVESAQFYEDIWTPLKVNVPQTRSDLPGIWLLCWYRVNVTYKNGAKLNYAVHTDFHFDSSDQVDLTILYMDRAPIVAALAPN